MESELGTALFDHSDQPFQLTDTGLYLYEHGQEVVFQFDQLVTDIREMNQKPVKKAIAFRLNYFICCTIYERNFTIFNNPSTCEFNITARWLAKITNDVSK